MGQGNSPGCGHLKKLICLDLLQQKEPEIIILHWAKDILKTHGRTDF